MLRELNIRKTYLYFLSLNIFNMLFLNYFYKNNLERVLQSVSLQYILGVSVGCFYMAVPLILKYDSKSEDLIITFML